MTRQPDLLERAWFALTDHVIRPPLVWLAYPTLAAVTRLDRWLFGDVDVCDRRSSVVQP